MSDTREQIAQRLFAWDTYDHPDPRPTWETLTEAQRDVWRSATDAVLPIATKAVTDRVREMHKLTPLATPIEDAGTGTCCGRNYPCPTVRLLNQIDSELGGE